LQAFHQAVPPAIEPGPIWAVLRHNCKARTTARPHKIRTVEPRDGTASAALTGSARPKCLLGDDATLPGMARSLGPRLSPALVERFSQRDLERRLGVALPLVTVDGDGRPHPMLLSYLEVRAYDSGTVGLVIQARSASARNLVERAVASLLILEPDAIVYVKMRLVDGPLDVAGADALGYFLLEVEDVLEDAPADWEGGVRITGPVRYTPLPALDDAWARATLAALAVPRARA